MHIPTVFEISLGLVVVLQVLDALTTYKALQQPNTREANPILAKLFEVFGEVPTLIATKLSAAIAIFLTASPEAIWVLYTIIAAYSYVVWNNYKIMKGE